MEFQVTWILGLVLVGLATAQGNFVNETALAELSPCVTQCYREVLQKYSCSPGESCFCNGKQPPKDIATCLASCPFSDQLASIRFEASTCNRAVRGNASIQALFYTLFGIATLFTIARIISRSRRLGGEGYSWDDYTALLSYIALIVTTVCARYIIRSGGGVDIWGVSVQGVHDFVYWSYIWTVLSTTVLFLTKVSLVLLFLRIWPAKSYFRKACWLALDLILVAFAAFLLVAILQCTPIDYQWARLIDAGRGGTCIDRETWMWSFAVMLILLDLLVLLLPVPKLFRLEMPRSRKVGLCAIYTVGLTVMALSFVRLSYIPGFTAEPNITRYYHYAGAVTNVEVSLSQICCCMPTIPCLIRRIHHYASGPAPADISLTEILRESKQVASSTSKPTWNQEYENDRSLEKPMTASNSSTYSGRSGAPAPVIQRHSNPFLQLSNSLPRTPSVFRREYRKTGHFQRRGGSDQYDVAIPPPAIARR